MRKPRYTRTSELIEGIIKDAGVREHVTLGDFIGALGDRAFGFAILVFAIPNSIPVPGIPGFSAITGLPLLLFGLQMIWGCPTPWLPRRMANYRFSQAKLGMILAKALPMLKRMEKFIKPRWQILPEKMAERLLGLAFFILAFILALPIPFGNFLPGFSMVILALGLVERDGLVILLGLIAGAFSAFIISGAIVLGVKALINLLQHTF